MSKNTPNTVLFIGIAVAVGILIGSVLDYQSNPAPLFSSHSQENKIKRLINYIQYDYVDEVNTDSLLDGAINQMLHKLDPHSVYIPKSELQGIQENMNGNFKGIGIQFRMIRDSVTVLNIIKGGPSEKAGLLAGDRILLVDNDTIYGQHFTSDQIMARLKGKDTNEVALTIYRKQNDTLLNFNFNRGSVNITSVPVYYMINESVGFIKVERFARNTYDEFHKALLLLKTEGMQTLILDLRGNTGGFMDIANEIADEFLSDDKLIVFTKNKAGKITNSTATTKGDFETGKIYVLIDEDSASASEIVAGALQDNDKGTIVGRRSFGKGLVQQEMDLGDGSAVRLTTARYYTPTGRSIQKPYDHKGNDTYFNDKIDRIHNGELLNKDSIPINDSLKYTTPKGKIVYGGGGIMPDVFVAIDTTLYYPAYQIGRINNFVFDYIDENRSQYSTITWDEFDENFDVNKMYATYSSRTNTTRKQKYSDPKLLKTYLKALTARELFDETGFYHIYEKQDRMVQKVLEMENNKQSVN